MTKVTVTPWEVNCKCSLVPSEKHTFAFEFSRFSNFLKIFQLLSHVCMNMAIQTANVHWSPAGSILFFTSQGGWTTFVTRLHEYGHPDCKCSLVPCEKHTFFHVKRGVKNVWIAILNFCHTSAVEMPSEFQMLIFPQREAYFFSPLKGGEQLLSHVCRNMAIQPANVHWSPARSILFFSRIHPWVLTSIWHYVFQGLELRYPKRH